MWSASFYIGNFIGPTVAGFLVDAYGFKWTTMVFFGMYGFILLVDIFELTYNVKKCKDTPRIRPRIPSRIISQRIAPGYEKMPQEDKPGDEKLPLLESSR